MSALPRGRFATLGALAAIMSLGLASAASPARASSPSPASREFVAPGRRGARRRKKKQIRKDDPPTTRWPGRWSRAAKRQYRSLTGDGPSPSQKWQQLKGGAMIDGRGDFRSAKRLRRQRVCQAYGIDTGRQWIRLRRYVARLVREGVGR